MGRNVKPRINWEDDARYLARLIKAVEMDEAHPLEWKQEVISLLNTVRGKFLRHASHQAITQAKSI